jgi:hypothetical protein
MLPKYIKIYHYEQNDNWHLVLVAYNTYVLWRWVKNNWMYWRLWTLDDPPEDGTGCAETYVGARNQWKKV